MLEIGNGVLNTHEEQTHFSLCTYLLCYYLWFLPSPSAMVDIFIIFFQEYILTNNCVLFVCVRMCLSSFFLFYFYI